MYKFIAVAALSLIASSSWANTVVLQPGQEAIVNNSTVIVCSGSTNTDPNPKWLCGCYYGFAQIGRVELFAHTREAAEKAALPKCKAERDKDTNSVECQQLAN